MRYISAGLIVLICFSVLITLPVIPVHAAGLNEPLVSFDFDDGNESAYLYALPIINAAGFMTTNYIITDRVGTHGYITKEQLLDMQQKGNEIGAHTKNHVNLAQASDVAAKAEIEGSRQDLLRMGVKSVTAFAYPFGAAKSTTASIVHDSGLTLARLTYPGFNDPSINPYALRRFALNASTTPEAAYNAIDHAIANRLWLILVMHHVDANNSQSISSSFLKQIVDYVRQKNVKVVTATEGYDIVFAATSTTPRIATTTPDITDVAIPAPTPTPTPTPTPASPEVPLQQTYTFTRQLWRGMSGTDVYELQKILLAKGFLQVARPTQYFGRRTEKALAAFQAAHSLDPVGRVGPKTLAILNGTSTPQSADKQALLDALTKRLQALLVQIAAMKAALGI